MKRSLILTAMAAIALGLVGAAQAGSLVLTVDTGDATGTLRAAAYSSQTSFDAGEAVTGVASPADGGKTQITFKGLDAGTYGIALFLDTNGNDELDTNLFGAPTEPYGFSQNPKLGFSAPKFQEFQFQYDSTDQDMTVKLNGN